MRYEDLDRMFFEVIRRALVLATVLPDQTLYGTADQYAAARKAILDAGTPLVDVYGVGTVDNRQEIINNRITVDRSGEEAGELGGSPVTYMERIGDLYQKSMVSDTSRNIDYEIRLMSYGIDMDRLMSKIVNYELGERRHMRTVNDQGNFTTDYALIKFMGSVDVSARTDMKEKLYKYKVLDVFISEDRPLLEHIVPMTSVEYRLYVKAEPGLNDTPDLTEIVT